MTAKEFNELLARCWFRRNLTLSISARRSIVLMIVAGTPYRRLGASVGSARRGARPRGCGGCRPDHCDRRQARCFCSSPCCRSSPLPAARPCRRCTVRPSRFARWLSDRQFSELVRHRARGAGTGTPRLSPLLGHFIAGVPSQLSRCAGRVASSSARCCRLSNTFARRAGYITVQAGLVPVTIGLIDASALDHRSRC